MSDKPAIRPDAAVGDALKAAARDILTEALVALDDPERSDAVAVHDYRKAMKRWRALLRLVIPFIGTEGERLRVEARDLARELAGARDAQSALDALDDLKDPEETLSKASRATLRRRIEDIRQAAEATTLTEATRGKLRASVTTATLSVGTWRLDHIGFSAVAGELAEHYRRARQAAPAHWSKAGGEELHRLRQRVVVHRYQMELVEPLWPRLTKLWVAEAQRLRERLGAHHDLTTLAGLIAPHQPLARWRSRLAALIAAREAAHVAGAARVAGRLFAEKPRAFRRRLEALWETRGEAEE
ncbi:MAG TPA: CHAD domain-containing protein [Xanthobacteraceae bacterium]|nr:CHAD domain-containing protein [Xanthobacteraceae bacterium]